MDNSFSFFLFSKIIVVEVMPMNIGDKIKEQRLKKGWTQERLAQLLNVSRPAVSSWEVGRNYPDLETIIAISDLFGISLDKLLREDKEMAKNTTKKLRRGKLYKIALITVGALFLLYFGFNTKLRHHEQAYRSNLEKNGWEQVSGGALENENNTYELTENDVSYWTYILPAGWINFPLTEHEPRIITTYNNDFIVRVGFDEEILVNISPENDAAIHKQIYVQTNTDGKLIENNEDWSVEYENKIINYLSEYQDIHTRLINQTFDKREEILKN